MYGKKTKSTIISCKDLLERMSEDYHSLGENVGELPSVSPERLCVWSVQNQGERDAGRLPPDL